MRANSRVNTVLQNMCLVMYGSGNLCVGTREVHRVKDAMIRPMCCKSQNAALHEISCLPMTGEREAVGSCLDRIALGSPLLLRREIERWWWPIRTCYRAASIFNSILFSERSVISNRVVVGPAAIVCKKETTAKPKTPIT